MFVRDTAPISEDINSADNDFFEFESSICENNNRIPDNTELEITKYFLDKRRDLHILKEYPLIRRVFLRYNTPMPSSVSVERLFSYASMINLPKSNKLSDSTFEKKLIHVQ